MAIAITIPRLGWNMDEGVFVGWLKSDGQRVAAGDPLFTLEGDKATQDIESLETGILRIPPDGPKDGDKVAVGTLIGLVATGGGREFGWAAAPAGALSSRGSGCRAHEPFGARGAGALETPENDKPLGQNPIGVETHPEGGVWEDGMLG